VIGVWWTTNGIGAFLIDPNFAPGHVHGGGDVLGVSITANGWHALFHLVPGLAGIAVASRPRAALAYTLGIGSAYVLAGAWGLIDGGDSLGPIAVDASGDAVHLAEGVIVLAAGLLTGANIHRATRALPAILAICSLAALPGCGTTHHARTTQTTTASTTPSTTTSSTTTASFGGHSRQFGHSNGVGVVTTAGLGSISYRCDAATQRVSATLDGAVSATEGVTVEAEQHRHLLAGTVGPPAHLTIPVAAYRSLTWRIIQSTEPRTLEATITLQFHTSQGGSSARIDCSPTRWTREINVIGHDKQWSPPPAWP
jgi:hypothetical protein